MTLAAITSTLGRTPATLIPAIEQYLYGNQRTQLNRLNGAITTTATTMTMGFTAEGVRGGAYVELEDELVYVWSVSGLVATIQRAMLGTTAASHADLTLARVEPRFLRAQMNTEIANEIRSWPSNIYARYAGDLAIGASVNAIDVAGLSAVPGAHLLRVQLSPTDTTDERWSRFDNVRLERRQQTATFASGYALVVPGDIGKAVTLRVVCRAPFIVGSLASGTDFGSLGLTNDLVDIIPWGVAARMVLTRDIARSDSNAQGRSRPAEEVRPGDAANVARMLLTERDRLLTEASNRLLAEDGMGWS